MQTNIGKVCSFVCLSISNTWTFSGIIQSFYCDHCIWVEYKKKCFVCHHLCAFYSPSIYISYFILLKNFRSWRQTILIISKYSYCLSNFLSQRAETGSPASDEASTCSQGSGSQQRGWIRWRHARVSRSRAQSQSKLHVKSPSRRNSDMRGLSPTKGHLSPPGSNDVSRRGSWLSGSSAESGHLQ